MKKKGWEGWKKGWKNGNEMILLAESYYQVPNSSLLEYFIVL